MAGSYNWVPMCKPGPEVPMSLLKMGLPDQLLCWLDRPPNMIYVFSKPLVLGFLCPIDLMEKAAV